MNIPFSSLSDDIDINVVDKDTFSDNFVGSLKIKPFQIIESFHKKLKKKLLFEGKVAGHITFQILEGPKVM